MIYISVDNNHQASLALLFIQRSKIPSTEVIFISHISARNTIVASSGINFQSIEIHPLCSGRSFKNPLSYVRSIFHRLRIKNSFKFMPGDTLVVTTEYELNNSLLAREMHKSKGSVYIFDEGIGYYFNNTSFHYAGTSRLDAFYLAAYNLAFKAVGLPAYARKGFEGRMYACIQDKYIDGIYSRMRLPIDRPVKVYGYRNFLASPQAQEMKNQGSVILFSSNLKAFGLEREERTLMEKVVQHLSEKFPRVYIKIHPSDAVAKNENFYFYKKLINVYSNTSLIDNSITGNEAMEIYKPRIVAGVLGATMFDAFFFGCHPIFLFHLLPPVTELRICKFILEGMDYKFVQSLEDVNPEYQCHVDVDSLLYDDEIKAPWEFPSMQSKISSQN